MARIIDILKKVLFITAHRKDRAPNQRFRFEQYFKFLEANGYQCTQSALIVNPKEDILFYSKKNYLKKIALGFRFVSRRMRDISRADSFDVIFVAREAFYTGSVFFERQLARSKAKIVFDFDDSIWINTVSTNNKFFSWIKDAAKTSKIIGMADLVIAGNEYLADYARQFNPKVEIIPTTIDTLHYSPRPSPARMKVIIGWSGSISTIAHFQHAIPALKILKELYGERIEFKIIGDGNYQNKELNIQGLPWKFDTELDDLQSIDIGIMPLPDDEWTRGKCALKALQYMSLEIPCVISPVGVNSKLISDGKNGFLASNTAEWVDKISLLITSPELRKNMGTAGRKTVVQNYSIESQKQKYLTVFNQLTGNTLS